MKISIIAIGTELLIGQVTDTNSGDIARYIAPFGWEVNDVQVVDDSPAEIRRAIDRGFETADVVITTGGLGPTKDDLTKQVLCDYFGGQLVEDPAVLENVKSIVARRGFQLNDLTAAQAIVPSSCRVIQNRVGTAPLMWFEKDGKVLVAMPGVPHETRTMWSEAVFPMLREKFPSDVNIAHATLIVTDYTESGLAEYIADFESSLPDYLHLAYLPKAGLIRLRLDGHHKDEEFIHAEVGQYAARLSAMLGPAVLATEDLSPAEILINKAREYGLTVASAESCTGGNIAHRITEVAGASDVFRGSVVSYATEVKTTVLGVDAELIEREGVVSEPVAGMMAAGALRVLDADIAVASTGVAGPGGGSEKTPVGTVCMAVARKNRPVETFTFRFPGDRFRVIDAATRRALILLIKKLI
ncbi:MAG: CinA family nicotinamide mononucleotide deamidase-related protein [Lachnoclostridium sp.]|nr:CinA family nicotinamide mononucleotide deamidase-related protein [Lachnoclostridium sp.]